MPRPPRRQPSRLRQMWVQWTRDAIREAQLNPDVSGQWEEANTIFAGIFGEASATVEDLARFDAAIARLARLRIDVDEETLQRLHELAVRERRSIDAQGAVLLRLAAGLPFPRPLHLDEGNERRRRCPLEN